MKISSNLNETYRPTDPAIWTGRKTDSVIGHQYWYQAIKLVDLKSAFSVIDDSKQNFALIGYACDEGVRRNQGRVGAVDGPIAIRKSLAKVALHFDNKNVIDVGDVLCIDNKMEDCQHQFSKVVEQLVNNNIIPIGLGGGHDIAYAHFMGLHAALENKSIGIINFDAHFDLRPVEQQSNSGTPFNQICQFLKSNHKDFNYFAIGIQKQSNTKQLFEIAKETGTQIIFNNECVLENIKSVISAIDVFFKQVDLLYITIDLDVFSSAYVKGVSAPSPLGMEPLFFLKVLDYLLTSKKIVGIDIAELNPEFDTNGMTANLAAKIIDSIVYNFYH